MQFAVHARGFQDEQLVPVQYTCDGENHSPAIGWEGAPPKTMSYALILDDPDAPGGTWTHWLLWDIPADTSSLAEACRPKPPMHSGVNDFGRHGYGGPCPPPGHGLHRYFVRLYALDVPSLSLAEDAHRGALERALQPHLLASATCHGVYERRTA